MGDALSLAGEYESGLLLQPRSLCRDHETGPAPAAGPAVDAGEMDLFKLLSDEQMAELHRAGLACTGVGGGVLLGS